MGSRTDSISLLCCFLILLSPLAAAQSNAPNSSGSHGGTSLSSSSSPATGGSYNYTESPSFKKSAHILIIHAVLGTLAWTFFAPLGAIFLRLNLPGVSLLKFHIVTQLFVYAMTIVTTGLGIFLAIGASKYGSVWTNSHVIIGLLIFSASSIQPWLGWIHHIVFKKRLIKYKKEIPTRRPGRTTTTRLHIWIGRTLILLGVINGALGIRLVSGTPYQTSSTTRKAEIAYGILAALMFLLFAGVSILFEYRRAARVRSRRTGQKLPALGGGQPVMANRRNMPSSPISSEDSFHFDEKGSEAGR